MAGKWYCTLPGSSQDRFHHDAPYYPIAKSGFIPRKDSLNFHGLKLKMAIHYINIIVSSDIRILSFLASSLRIGSRSTYFIAILRLNWLRSNFPPLLANIHRIRSRGDCDELVISRIATSSLPNHYLVYLLAHLRSQSWLWRA